MVTVKAEDVMTTKVITVRPEDSVRDAAQLMAANEISGLPVVTRAGEIVGIVTERDLLRHMEIKAAKRPDWLDVLVRPEWLQEQAGSLLACKVADVMTADPLTIAADVPLQAACALMRQHDVKRLPVVRGKALVGILARADLVRALANEQLKPFAPSDDVARRDRMLALERSFWQHRCRSPYEG